MNIPPEILEKIMGFTPEMSPTQQAFMDTVDDRAVGLHTMGQAESKKLLKAPMYFWHYVHNIASTPEGQMLAYNTINTEPVKHALCLASIGEVATGEGFFYAGYSQVTSQTPHKVIFYDARVCGDLGKIYTWYNNKLRYIQKGKVTYDKLCEEEELQNE